MSVIEKPFFFTKIQKWLDKFALNENSIIIGGDFNYTHENSLDRYKHNDIKDVSSWLLS